MYAQLLIDLFKYLAPFLRNVELTKPMQILYKVSCRKFYLASCHLKPPPLVLMPPDRPDIYPAFVFSGHAACAAGSAP